ncbi:MAG TPA: hypothetical protein VEK07_06580 [Polyangiaceae bacterium]|nr:hypothetical protein [Polyangiaceae bacterium]
MAGASGEVTAEKFVSQFRFASTAQAQGRWRVIVAALASLQAHVAIWAAMANPSAAPLAPATASAELEVALEPAPPEPAPDPPPRASVELQPRGPSRGAGHTSDPHTPAPASRALTNIDPTPPSPADFSLVQGPSLDWLYAIVAARGDGDGLGEGGGGGAPPAGGSPARVASDDWRWCPAHIEHAPAIAHLTVEVDPRGRALQATLVDADSGCGAAAIRCAMSAAYLPARDARGRPVRGKTRIFRVQFLGNAAQ